MSQKVRDLIQASAGQIGRLTIIPLTSFVVVGAHDASGAVVCSRILVPAEKEALEMMLGGRLS